MECDCKLLWFRTLANETRNVGLKSKLIQLSCYMKGINYNDEDPDQDLRTNGLSDSRVLHDSVSIDAHSHEYTQDSMARMLNLLQIPPERLPCPEKRQSNEILMEQMSKKDTNSANTMTIRSTTDAAISTILILLAYEAFVL